MLPPPNKSCVYTPYGVEGHKICQFEYAGRGYPSKIEETIVFSDTTFQQCAEKCVSKEEQDGIAWDSFYWFYSHQGLCKCVKNGSGMILSADTYFYRLPSSKTTTISKNVTTGIYLCPFT